MVIIILNGYKRGGTLNMKKWLETWGKFPIFDEYKIITPFQNTLKK
jgi:hypothetical protein